MDELKPCPFCSGEAHAYESWTMDESYVACEDCNAIGPRHLAGRKSEAIAAWNTRTPDAGASHE